MSNSLVSRRDRTDRWFAAITTYCPRCGSPALNKCRSVSDNDTELEHRHHHERYAASKDLKVRRETGRLKLVGGHPIPKHLVGTFEQVFVYSPTNRADGEYVYAKGYVRGHHPLMGVRGDEWYTAYACNISQFEGSVTTDVDRFTELYMNNVSSVDIGYGSKHPERVVEHVRDLCEKEYGQRGLTRSRETAWIEV